jgi:hypothetical protein
MAEPYEDAHYVALAVALTVAPARDSNRHAVVVGM